MAVDIQGADAGPTFLFLAGALRKYENRLDRVTLTLFFRALHRSRADKFLALRDSDKPKKHR